MFIRPNKDCSAPASEWGNAPKRCVFFIVAIVSEFSSISTTQRIHEVDQPGGPQALFNTKNVFLEIAPKTHVGVLESLRKHHKSKDLNFLHRSCTSKKIQPRKNIFLSRFEK